jgi:hypothetical protein
MFDLNNEVDRWCRSVLSDQVRSPAMIDELKDHLHSVVETLVEEGMSEQQAFRTAIERMGDCEVLKHEYMKNRTSLLDRLLRTEGRLSRMMCALSPRQTAVLQVVVALFFAAAIIGSSYLLRDSDYQMTVQTLLIAVYCIPFTLLTVAGTRQELQSRDC